LRKIHTILYKTKKEEYKMQDDNRGGCNSGSCGCDEGPRGGCGRNEGCGCGPFGGLFGGNNCGCGDSGILFFIIIFLLLFTNNGCCGGR
jgi:hypothetical protein